MMIKLGLLGEHLSHSLSPKIHNLLFEELELEGKYDLFEKKEKDVSEFIEEVSKKTIGINVTIPYKIKVISSLDWISEEAKKIGAVNTIHFKDGKKYGYNTDYFGFSRLLGQNDIDVLNKEVVILGAGGAARAVITCVRDLKAKEIVVVARNLEKATSELENLLDKDIRIISFDDLEKENKKGYLIINSTPVGMFPNIEACPVSDNIIKNYEACVDLIYNPLETEFLKKARLGGKKSVNGMFMLVAQAIASEEIWLDKKIGNNTIEKISKRINDKINIILIGMPGSGKSYIGKKLAERLNREFIDSDEYLQNLEKKSISELFQVGEEYFRQAETKTIRKISLEKNKIISTGGGVIKNYENIELLKKNGIIIFLNRPLEKIIEDIDIDSRPLLLKGKEQIYNIYNQRLKLYKKYSDYIIENKTSVDEVVDSIISIIK
ncbi:shikimate dehydrogenase [Fusobacterium sp. MFO224]|uniref:shikimate dehydrogenase n=1 Tax=Fusobacterium sp. MFO224 TaxID=3378070 RepID=UPI0038521BA7